MNETQEHRIEVRKSARYYTYRSGSGPVRRVWMLCHGYGQLAEPFLRGCTPLADEHTLLVAPEGLSRFYTRRGGGQIGATWMTSEDRLAEIADYVAYLDVVWEEIRDLHGPDVECRVLGFSQGGATAARWGMFGAGNPSTIVLWGTTLELHEFRHNVGRLQNRELIFVNGAADRLVNRAQLDEALAGLPDLPVGFRVLHHTGGHELDARLLEEIAALPTRPATTNG